MDGSGHNPPDIRAWPAWLGLKGPAPPSWPDRAWAVFTASAGWGTELARLTPVKLGPRDNRALPWGANPLYRRSSPLSSRAPEEAGPPRMPATGDRLPGWMEGFGAGSFLRRPLTLRSGHDKITGQGVGQHIFLLCSVYCNQHGMFSRPRTTEPSRRSSVKGLVWPKCLSLGLNGPLG